MARKRARQPATAERTDLGPRKAPRALAPVWIAAGLAVLTLGVFAQTRGFAFVNWDDPQYITANPHVVGGLTWTNASWALTTGYPPYWHPLTWLSHLTDITLFGLDPGWHHLTNVSFHLVSVLVLFELLRRMTGAIGASAFVAGVFAVHPLHVESVAWVAERKDVLSTLGVWATMAAYLGYVRRPDVRRYAWVVVLFALALMAKPMVVTLPVVLLLLDVWPLSRVSLAAGSGGRWRHLVVEKLPLVGLAIAASAATVVLQQRAGATAGLDVLPWSVRLANAVVACVRYLGHAVWPIDLAAFYPYPQSFPAAVVIGATALLAAITVGALTQRRSRSYLLVGWLWFLVTLSPVLGFLQAGEQAMADRFMYVPLVGLSIALAWAARDLGETRPALRRPIAAAALIAVLACAVVAYSLTSSWRDSLTLWTRAAAVTPANYMAEEKLGEALRDRGDSAGALAHYTRALELAPASDKYQAVVRNDLGLVLMEEGRAEDALAYFKESSRRDPSFAEARTNLGNSLAAAGRPAEAIPHYEAAVALDPSAAAAQVGLGSALLGQGRPADAQPHFAAALQIDPSLAQAHNGLGSSLAMQDRLDDALVQYREAIRLKPDLPTAHFNVAVVLIKQGRTDEARRELEAALTIDPGYAQARQVLDAIKSRRQP